MKKQGITFGVIVGTRGVSMVRGKVMEIIEEAVTRYLNWELKKI